MADLHENWEPKLVFENEKTKLSKQIEQLADKIGFLEEEEKSINLKVKSEEESLKGLEELEKLVSKEEIIELKLLIVDSGIKVSTFRREVERLGSVTAAVDATEKEKRRSLAELERKVTALEANVGQLEKRKTELEANITTLTSGAVREIEEASKTIKGVAETLKTDFTDPETGFDATIKSSGSKAGNEMSKELIYQRQEFANALEKLRNFIKSSIEDIDYLRKEAWGSGKVVGISIHLERLANIIGTSLLTGSRPWLPWRWR